ncbi:flagellar basal-body rod protein FlgG [Zavarzinia sp. CC-PAN008]|uniref:flagellar basal-body rod protein FlgG n=1 Tax=Zavarzinia sp. CC-PAN008 TaxID=3243332 RepID=UPI003F743BCC
MRSLSIAATGMLAQQLNVEVISNNIANMSTTGFKRSRAEFQDLLYQASRRVGSASSDAGTILPSGVQVGLGVRTGSVYRINEQGNLALTENTYDLAIQGNGFFRVQLPSGDEAYTRSGAFQVSETGQLVTPDGYQVLPGVVIPQNATAVSINATGEVSVKLQGQVAPQVVGQLDLATFFNEGGLESIGDNLLLETPSSGPATTGTPGTDGIGTVLQGYLETSNVNPVQEITQLIQAQRAYEMNSKVITTSDQMLQTTTQLR